ncbi:hypothetical protein J2Z21_002827 [Streptomyces griseochromogenes]|uniref:Transposase n=1 Tax=Streptomyces griseochromogenes TaxID=68214 RepID=A0ABS4LRV0_9ACTN|nr:hypothetical protein [Streptomyces griseochromogenes]
MLSDAQGITLAVGVSGANMHDSLALKPLIRGIPIERSIAWLFGYRRLTVRYERKGSHFLAFLGLAAALTCYKKLAKLAT